MASTRIRLGRIAPGTAYTAGNDALAVTPFHNCVLVVEASVSVGGKLFKRVNSVNIEMNDGVPLVADRVYSFKTVGDPNDAISFRFENTATIRELYVDEIDGDI